EPPDEPDLLEQRLLREAAACSIAVAPHEEALVAVRHAAAADPERDQPLEQRLVPRACALEREPEATAGRAAGNGRADRGDRAGRRLGVRVQEPEHVRVRGSGPEIELRAAVRGGLPILAARLPAD